MPGELGITDLTMFRNSPCLPAALLRNKSSTLRTSLTFSLRNTSSGSMVAH